MNSLGVVFPQMNKARWIHQMKSAIPTGFDVTSQSQQWLHKRYHEKLIRSGWSEQEADEMEWEAARRGSSMPIPTRRNITGGGQSDLFLLRTHPVTSKHKPKPKAPHIHGPLGRFWEKLLARFGSKLHSLNSTEAQKLGRTNTQLSNRVLIRVVLMIVKSLTKGSSTTKLPSQNVLTAHLKTVLTKTRKSNPAPKPKGISHVHGAVHQALLETLREAEPELMETVTTSGHATRLLNRLIQQKYHRRDDPMPTHRHLWLMIKETSGDGGRRKGGGVRPSSRFLFSF
jgi:hypothetical protein